jgi:hypothetical protein
VWLADGRAVRAAVEEQKRLYQELPFSVLPGMRRQSFQRERSFSNLKARSSWGSFTNLVKVRRRAHSPRLAGVRSGLTGL